MSRCCLGSLRRSFFVVISLAEYRVPPAPHAPILLISVSRQHPTTCYPLPNPNPQGTPCESRRLSPSSSPYPRQPSPPNPAKPFTAEPSTTPPTASSASGTSAPTT